MKLLLALILSLSTIYVYGQQTFSPKCDCHADNFMAKLLDERRCLQKEDGNGIPNCQESDWDSTHGLECTKCSSAYAIDEKLQCIPHQLPECIEGQINTGMGSNSSYPHYADGFICTKCNSGFFPNKDGWCTANPGNITNCDIYEQNGVNVNASRCHTCDENYWIQADDQSACAATPPNATAGLIDNCAKYINANGTAAGFSCHTCDENYWIQADDNSACAPTPPNATAGLIDNCAKYINANGTAAGFSCHTCDENYWIQADDNSACAPTPPNATAGLIDNCAKYTNANGTAAGFSCHTCDENYWIQADDNSACAASPPNTTAGKIDHCDKYINANGTAAGFSCHTCEDTYIKNTAADTCWPTPINTTEPSTWTINCKTWTHPTTKYQCTSCNGHNYLESGGTEPECLPVQRNIEHCTLYSNAQTCTTCEDRYWLEDGICVECPAEKYVPPVPVTCPNNTNGNPPGNNTNGNPPGNNTNGNPGTGSPNTTTNGTNSNSIILSTGFVLALSLLLL